MLLAVLLSFVVCPQFGLMGVHTDNAGIRALREAERQKELGNVPYNIADTPVNHMALIPVNHMPVIPVNHHTFVGFQKYPSRNFAFSLMSLAFFMDILPQPYGENFTVEPIFLDNWTVPPGSREPFLDYKVEGHGLGRTVQMTISQPNANNEIPPGEFKSMSLKYSRLIELYLFDRWQKFAESDSDLDFLGSQFLTCIGWLTPTSAVEDPDYSYFIADYLLKKISTHFEWSFDQPWFYIRNKVKFNESMDKALEELSPEKLSEMADEDKTYLAALKKKSKEELMLEKNVATLSIGDKRVKVVWAEMDFEKYGTRLYQTIREVLGANDADFCMLWEKNNDKSVTLLVPKQFDKDNKELWTHLEKVANSNDASFCYGELTVDREGWENIKNTLEKKGPGEVDIDIKMMMMKP
eukprot:GHVS01074913.1.p1 GENE.GHVS01074913.1~~GHVS01074913.1.p1  ORF type:complete len:410 (+),score=37.18 GHVS01074913.1:59-1288(+)